MIVYINYEKSLNFALSTNIKTAAERKISQILHYQSKSKLIKLHQRSLHSFSIDLNARDDQTDRKLRKKISRVHKPTLRIRFASNATTLPSPPDWCAYITLLVQRFPLFTLFATEKRKRTMHKSRKKTLENYYDFNMHIKDYKYSFLFWLSVVYNTEPCYGRGNLLFHSTCNINRNELH